MKEGRQSSCLQKMKTKRKNGYEEPGDCRVARQGEDH